MTDQEESKTIKVSCPDCDKEIEVEIDVKINHGDADVEIIDNQI